MHENVILKNGSLKRRKRWTNTLTSGPKLQPGNNAKNSFQELVKSYLFIFLNDISTIINSTGMSNGLRQNITRLPILNSRVMKRNAIKRSLWKIDA